MADDAARIEQLEAELRQLRALQEADRAAIEQRDRALAEALEQQAASAEILRVIASSPTELQAVLQEIVEAAARLCDATGGGLFRLRPRDGQLAVCAATGVAAEVFTREFGEDFFEQMPGSALTHDSMSGRAFLERRTVAVADMLAAQAEFPASRENQRRYGHRSQVSVPLLRRGEPIGILALTHLQVRPFTTQQIALLETFADKAVIAIENARLFAELEQRNHELHETLQQQTATADVLRIVASSPTNLETVLSSIADTSTRLCDADFTVIHRETDGGLHCVAGAGTIDPDVLETIK